MEVFRFVSIAVVYMSAKRFLMLPVLLLASVYSVAATTTDGNVTEVLLYEDHSGILFRHSAPIDSTNCGRKDYFVIPMGHKYHQEAYSMLLAAKASVATLSVAIEGCHEGIPKVKHISIK